jgi:GrpB-like predicted nucleotidyltransferase (UPF0157 family)
MTKLLSEMSNEELWQLFPIIITEHNNKWKELFLSEKKLIEELIGKNKIVRINHIGSTAVPNLLAKPTIDILVEIKDNTDIPSLIKSLESIDYIYSPQPQKPPPHMMFLKGYTPEGFKGQVFHIHVRYYGDWDEIYFRDYLINHPDVAKEYGNLKLDLKEKYEHDRDGYTQAKTDFIKQVTNIARNNK